MKVLIWADSLAGGTPVHGFLKAFDPDAHDGRGDIVFTRDVSQALKFDDGAQALECWRRQSTVRPVRPDGKPNRPLTAFTIEIISEDKAADVIVEAVVGSNPEIFGPIRH
jgi:hypothetical protein